MLRIFGILIGIMGTVVFALPFFAGIFNAGSLAGTFLSLVLFFACMYEKKLKMHTGSIRYAYRLVQAGYVVFLCIAAAACWSMYKECRNAPEEGKPYTIVVLGCGLEGDQPSRSLLYRLRRAQEWLTDHPDVHVVVSGGQGSDEIMPEAQCMAEWLVNHGIEAERVHQEDRSSSTYENLFYTRTVLQENGLPEDIIIVTNSFHVCRACLIARKQGYECTALPAKTTWWLFPASVLREVLGIVLEWFKG